MNQLAVMRMANGKLFTLMIKGQEHLAMWPDSESAIRYKARNPDLMVFVPALVGSAFGQKALAPFQKDGMGLLLFADNGGSHFHNGRKITWQEVENSVPNVSVPANPAPVSPVG